MKYQITKIEYPIVTTIKKSTENFAVAIVFNSAESRSLLYSKVLRDDSVLYTLLINFQNPEHLDFLNPNLEKNKLILNKISKKIEVLQLNSIFDYNENLTQIIHSIPRESFADTSKFFIDMTGAPLIYSTALLKHFKICFPSPKLYMFNVSAKYEKGGLQQFSDGRLDDIFIPGFFGRVEHDKPFHYVFLLGYEGERSLSILKSNEPEYVSVIIPDPGYEQKNAMITIKNNHDFLQEIGISSTSNFDLMRIPVGDVEGVRDAILSLYAKIKNNELLRLVPLCPKPHAIGAALAAMEEPDISMIYQVPKKYHLSDVKPADKMWLYII